MLTKIGFNSEALTILASSAFSSNLTRSRACISCGSFCASVIISAYNPGFNRGSINTLSSIGPASTPPMPSAPGCGARTGCPVVGSMIGCPFALRMGAPGTTDPGCGVRTGCPVVGSMIGCPFAPRIGVPGIGCSPGIPGIVPLIFICPGIIEFWFVAGCGTRTGCPVIGLIIG